MAGCRRARVLLLRSSSAPLNPYTHTCAQSIAMFVAMPQLRPLNFIALSKRNAIVLLSEVASCASLDGVRSVLSSACVLVHACAHVLVHARVHACAHLWVYMCACAWKKCVLTTTVAASREFFYLSRNGRIHLYCRQFWQLAGQNFLGKFCPTVLSSQKSDGISSVDRLSDHRGYHRSTWCLHSWLEPPQP